MSIIEFLLSTVYSRGLSVVFAFSASRANSLPSKVSLTGHTVMSGCSSTVSPTFPNRLAYSSSQPGCHLTAETGSETVFFSRTCAIRPPLARTCKVRCSWRDKFILENLFNHHVQNVQTHSGVRIRFRRIDNQSGLKRWGSWLSDDYILQHQSLGLSW